MDKIGLDSQKVENQVAKVMGEEIKYIPIRHNSPGSAILVKRCLEEYKPKLVLIEGPYLADDLIKYIIAHDTIPPFALLSVFSDEQNHFKLNGIISPDVSVPAKFQFYYPFISYSPELVALKFCYSKNIITHFIDLPITGIIPFLIREEDRFLHTLKQEEEQLKSSLFYKELSQIFQFDSFNETWDTLFEIGANRVEIDEILESYLIFCACVRQSIPNMASELNGSIEREKFMKYNIEHYRKKHGVDKKDVMIITGGIHSVVLADTVPQKISFLEKGLFNSLVPYSYYRMSEAYGYGSGNQGPQFYEYIWENFVNDIKYSFEAAALELITDIYSDARGKKYDISVVDSINTFQSAKMLAMIRRRSEPCLNDIVDAIFMSLVKGNPEIEGAYLKEFIRKRVVGFKLGKITKSIKQLPLQADFYLRFESFSINLKEKSKRHELNLRDEFDKQKSHLFWRVKYLDLGILERSEGPDLLKGVSGVFKEVWFLSWNPNVDGKLIELSNYGSTIEEATKNMLIEESKKNIKDFQKISFLLYQTLVMGLPTLFPHIVIVCIDSLDKDDKFLTLSRGFNNLIMISRFLHMMKNQGYNLNLITKLISRCYFASCFSLPIMANPPKNLEDAFIIAAKDMATTLIGLSTLKLNINVYEEGLKTCIDNSDNDFIRGGCIGILYLMNSIQIKDIKYLIREYVKSEDLIKVRVGEFVRGLIFICQTKLLYNSDIIKLLSEIIEDIETKVFLSIVPSLRKTFSELSLREYEVFVEKIAELYGLKTSKFKEITEKIENKYLIFFFQINEKVYEIFKKWFGEV